MSNPILPEFKSLQLEAVNEKTTSDRLFELAQISTPLAQLVAKNLCTPPELLRELANSSDVTTHQHVAANPNTPTEVLLKLGGNFPQQLLDNPIFSLLLLENPYLAKEMPISTLISLLKLEKVPVSLLQLGVNRGYDTPARKLDDVFHEIASAPKARLGRALAMNAQTPRTILEQLIESWGSRVQEAARLHVNWAGEMQEGWDEVASEAIPMTTLRYGERESIRILANRGLIPARIIKQLVKHVDSHVRESVVLNPNTPIKFLKQLAQDKDSRVRAAVALNSNIPVKFLEELARDTEYSVRSNVAKNPNASVELLEELAQDTEYSVRKFVAENPNAPTELLEQLARDTDCRVREFVAYSPNTPVKLLEQLVQDRERSVRRCAAKNSNIPIELLEQLAQDRYEDVRKSVANNPNTPVKLSEDVAQYRNEFIRQYNNQLFAIPISQHPNTPAHLLKQLAQDENYSVRIVVAKKPNTPVQLLELLAQDENEWVRQAVASNPNTPLMLLEQLLKHLAEYENQLLREFVTRHPKTPVSLLLEITLKFCPQDYNPSLIRFLVLLHPQAPYPALGKYYCSEIWLERYAIAQNPNTPLDIVHTLAKDANRIVRAAATANLQSRLKPA